MKNQGISLISLIITIIVIIILAAVVIFSGMDTPERAQLADFSQQVSNVSSAILDQLTGVTIEFDTQGKTRNTEQKFYRLATGTDCGQYGRMQTTGEGANSGETDTECQNIITTYAAKKTKDGGLGLTLPTVREHNEAWYVTEDGKVFNATGFVSGGKTYFTPNLYVTGELKVDSATNAYGTRADKIAKALVRGYVGDLAAATDADIKVTVNANGEMI